jgi:hypothetical protein
MGVVEEVITQRAEVLRGQMQSEKVAKWQSGRVTKWQGFFVFGFGGRKQHTVHLLRAPPPTSAASANLFYQGFGCA